MPIAHPSPTAFETEIQQLKDQLAHTQQRGGNLADGRLRRFLQQKVRQFDAEMGFLRLALHHRPAATPSLAGSQRTSAWQAGSRVQ